MVTTKYFLGKRLGGLAETKREEQCGQEQKAFIVFSPRASRVSIAAVFRRYQIIKGRISMESRDAAGRKV